MHTAVIKFNEGRGISQMSPDPLLLGWSLGTRLGKNLLPCMVMATEELLDTLPANIHQ